MEKICEYCSKKYTVPQYRSNTSKFCSNICRHKWFRPSEEEKIRISNKLKWVKLSQERRKAISEWHKGLIPGNKWKHYKLPQFSEEHRKKIGLSSKGRKYTEEINMKKWLKLEKHPLWKWWITNKPYSTDWTNTLRRSIRERDRYTCQLCTEQQWDCAFDIHHIDYDKLNCNPTNLITLCRSCHMKTNTNREYRKSIFTNNI